MKNILRLCTLIVLFLMCSIGFAAAQENSKSILGKWKLFDSGKLNSIVQIYEEDGKYIGKMFKLFDNPDMTCDKCADDDPRKNQPAKDMVIFSAAVKEADKDKDNPPAYGNMLDVASGKIYDCKLWLEDVNNLNVRYYVGFLFGTVTWQRLEE